MLYLAFLWHMHQPYYKNLLTEEVYLPWVRFHGIKDYLDMLLILEKYPRIKATFNLVPSLIDQIEDYNSSHIKDVYLEISRKKTQDLSLEDKIFILNKFFMLNWENMVKPYPRYHELLTKRGELNNAQDIKNALKRYNTQDFLDLVVWFNLAWFDPFFKQTIPELGALLKKGKKFTEEEKNLVLDKQIEILKQIIPKYKEMQDKGQIEVSVSPYYHPIMPLILDTESARQSMPLAHLPKQRCQFPEDLTWQIEQALEKYQRYFGRLPQGMWPSEGSVSESILAHLIKKGINWIATDEEILWRSLGRGRTNELLFQPYLLERKEGRLNIIFRDHGLSDLIGFVYHRWKENQAVDDFLSRLRKINAQLPQNRNYLVPVILDGENAWEYYPNDALDFLNLLYERLSNDGEINCVTVSEFLKTNPGGGRIERLFAGSWINGNFSIWIGQEDKNLSWEYLSRTRKDLVEFLNEHAEIKDSREAKLAWQNIYIAEGSDWNWWYGPEHASATEEEFDRIYRMHLANVYINIGREVPDFLKIPIITQRLSKYLEPTGLINPRIDGLLTNFYEWVGAGFIDLTKIGTSMHAVSRITQALWYGFNLENLFLRLDLVVPADLKNPRLIVNIFPREARLEIPLEKSRKLSVCTWQKQDRDNWQEFPLPNEAAWDRLLEIKFNYLNLGMGHGEEIKLNLTLMQDDLVLERIPPQGALKIRLPHEEYDAWQWSA
jgi:alpha-amylase/alpha-mannosidase (GH57 family)